MTNNDSRGEVDEAALEKGFDGLLVYGSLVDKKQIYDIFGSDVELHTVTVDGFKRCFNQKSDYRVTEAATECLVLNAVKQADKWMNAVLVTGFDEDGFRTYLQRETGYEIIPVPVKDIEPYDGSLPSVTSVGISHGQRQVAEESEYEPIPEYVTECINGVKQWSDVFLRDFVLTTQKF